MTISYPDLCQEIVQCAKKMEAAGFVIGTSGNVSARVPDEAKFLITPSSLPYAEMKPEDTILMSFEGEVLSGERSPSSEYRVHLKIYQARKDVNAVLHTHSLHASALACLHLPIPTFVDELIMAVGGPVSVSDYAVPGSQELADNAAAALGDRAAALLANHGTLCVGSSLVAAFHVAELLERAAQMYLVARTAGLPVELPAGSVEMQKMIYDYLRSSR